MSGSADGGRRQRSTGTSLGDSCACLHSCRTSSPSSDPCRYENIVQIRCLLEGVDPDEMLLHWHDMLPQYMQRWQLDRAEASAVARCAHLYPMPPPLCYTLSVLPPCTRVPSHRA